MRGFLAKSRKVSRSWMVLSREIPARSRWSQSRSVGAPRTLGERVYQQLRQEIIHGVFQSGEAINEKVLPRKYRGSRSPVREGVMRRQQENLLRLGRDQGYSR